MRKIIYAGIALASFFLNSCGPTHVVVEEPVQQPPPPPPPAPEVSYQSFYDALSPYGQWIDYPQYGYVWMPDVGPDFKPYATNGNWVYTDGGWTWASNYPWGWATFHYGRWFFEDGYGWMWIPGNEWAPAWVSWRQSSDYYGWAPLGPSVSISVSNGGGYNPPAHYWCFVPQQYVTSPHVNNYYVSEQQNVTIVTTATVIHNTTIVNNNVTNNRVTVNNYAGGPDPAAVSRVTGTPLRPVALRESNTPGESMAGGGLTIYRPRVNAAPQGSGSSTARPVPTHVQPLTSVHPVNTTIYNNMNNRTTNNNTTTNNTTINNNNSRNANTNNISNTNNINTTTNNNVNNRTAVNPSHTAPSGNAGQPASPGATRPNPPVFNRPPAAVTGHPTQAATQNNPPKPAPKKGSPPPVKKKRPIPKNDTPQQ